MANVGLAGQVPRRSGARRRRSGPARLATRAARRAAARRRAAEARKRLGRNPGLEKLRRRRRAGTSGGVGASGSVSTQLPSPGSGYTTYDPRTTRVGASGAERRWGTAETVRAVEEIGHRWFAHDRGARTIKVGDIGIKGGGFFGSHKTHHHGTSVDLRPLAKTNTDLPMAIWPRGAYDSKATEKLLRIIRDVNPGADIIFNDRRMIGLGLCRAAPGHGDHIHVTFRGPHALKPVPKREEPMSAAPTQEAPPARAEAAQGGAAPAAPPPPNDAWANRDP